MIGSTTEPAGPAGLLDGFPVVVHHPISWGDMDAFGHVNNTVYFRHFEHARIAYFEQIAMLEVMKETGVGPILSKTSCRFRIPLAYPDTVWIGARVSAVGDDRFTMLYRVVSETLGVVAAEGSGRIVTYDYEAGAKATIPAEIVRAIEAIESADT